MITWLFMNIWLFDILLYSLTEFIYFRFILLI